jgi:hypothetical protein
MAPMSKVDLFAAIRRDSRAGMSVRALARQYRVSRRTVRSALLSAWPQPRKQLPPRPSKLDEFKPIIDGILRADLDAPRKQRHTVKRIYDRLLAEHHMLDVSYAVVRAYVADRKPKIRAEDGRGSIEVFLPQTHRPGVETLCGKPHKISSPGGWSMIAWSRPRAAAHGSQCGRNARSRNARVNVEYPPG